MIRRADTKGIYERWIEDEKRAKKKDVFYKVVITTLAFIGIIGIVTFTPNPFAFEQQSIDDSLDHQAIEQHTHERSTLSEDEFERWMNRAYWIGARGMDEKEWDNFKAEIGTDYERLANKLRLEAQMGLLMNAGLKDDRKYLIDKKKKLQLQAGSKEDIRADSEYRKGMFITAKKRQSTKQEKRKELELMQKDNTTFNVYQLVEWLIDEGVIMKKAYRTGEIIDRVRQFGIKSDKHFGKGEDNCVCGWLKEANWTEGENMYEIAEKMLREEYRKGLLIMKTKEEARLVQKAHDTGAKEMDDEQWYECEE